MKFLVLKFFIIFLYLITINLSYSIEPPDIKNIVIKKDFKSYENVVFKEISGRKKLGQRLGLSSSRYYKVIDYIEEKIAFSRYGL